MPSRRHRSLTVTSRRKPSSTIRIFSSGVYLRLVAALTVLTKDLAASVRSSAAVALTVSIWDMSTPPSEVLYLIQGTDPTSNLSAFSTPSGVPIFADDLQTHDLCALGHRLVQELLAAKRDLDLPRRLRKLDSFDFLLLDDLGYLPQGAEESEVLFTLIAERYERRSLGITSNLVFSEWERIFANPMATAAAIDRVVHHSVILEFDLPSYRTDAAQQRGQAEEVNRQN